MKMRMTGMLMLAALSMPLVGFASANVQMGGSVGKLNLEKARLQHENYKFMILAKEGVLAVKTGKSCELALSGHIKSVEYQAIAPNRDFGLMTMKEFVTYWNPGESFAKDSPNAGLVAKDKKGEMMPPVVVTLTGIHYKDGDDKVKFDCTFVDAPLKSDMKFKDGILLVDGAGPPVGPTGG